MNWRKLDLINPLDGWLGAQSHGPMHRFRFIADGSFTCAEVGKLLNRYGIRIWGRDLTEENERSFLVKCTQAVWAEYILCRAGVPLIPPLLDPRNADYYNQHTPGTMPTPWTEKGIGPHSFVDHVVDLLVKLVS